ncbi:hypothetical protein KIN20_026091 [Parelaphostrongylus tenuis]|uniref:Uncharacterized protein n=1 Tax=Parelaphostrongylus tenuis TaxID=148309 RepID=A0AAD5QXV5_PARTN|nr:hypothetical protein KIN20_026091 [Parelaphostrongylus tenuis]
MSDSPMEKTTRSSDSSGERPLGGATPPYRRDSSEERVLSGETGGTTPIRRDCLEERLLFGETARRSDSCGERPLGGTTPIRRHCSEGDSSPERELEGASPLWKESSEERLLSIETTRGTDSSTERDSPSVRHTPLDGMQKKKVKQSKKRTE